MNILLCGSDWLEKLCMSRMQKKFYGLYLAQFTHYIASIFFSVEFFAEDSFQGQQFMAAPVEHPALWGSALNAVVKRGRKYVFWRWELSVWK